MADEPLGIATIGAGGIAGAHLKALAGIPEARLVAVADIDAERARARVEEFGGDRWFTDYADAIACPGVDAVIICLPHSLHREAVEVAARAGKHILVEKPMATTLADADAMVRAADAAGITLMVGQVLRFRESNQRVREMIRAGKIGRPRSVIRRRLSWFRDWVPWSRDPRICGGIALYGFGSHEIDTVLWLQDTHATRVYAEGEKINPVWQDYDEVSVQMRLANGCVFSLQHSLNTKHGAYDCLIVGDEGTLFLTTESIELNGETTSVPLPAGGGMTEQLREFVAAVREGREPEASGRQVRDTTMAALEAARLSLDSHAVVNAGDLLKY